MPKFSSRRLESPNPERKRTDFSGAQTILFFQLALTSAIKLFMRPTTRLSILGLTLVSLVTAWPAQAATYEWLTDNDGSWSVATNWLNGIAPPAGGASDAILVFDSSDFGADATNDLPGVFSLNQMIFDHDGTDILTVKSNSGSSLSFTGTKSSDNRYGRRSECSLQWSSFGR